MTHPQHDTHAIPPDDEPAAGQPLIVNQAKHGDTFYDRDHYVDMWTAINTGETRPRFFWNYEPGNELHSYGSTLEEVEAQYGPLTKVEPAPAKTHDLSIQFRNGNAVITVGNEPDGHQVYLPVGVAEDLGRALSHLTPTQRQLLVDVLTGGEG